MPQQARRRLQRSQYPPHHLRIAQAFTAAERIGAAGGGEVEGLAVELAVQECADDLQQVTRNLAHGVDEVKAVEQVLSRSREALAESETSPGKIDTW